MGRARAAPNGVGNPRRAEEHSPPGGGISGVRDRVDAPGGIAQRAGEIPGARGESSAGATELPEARRAPPNIPPPSPCADTPATCVLVRKKGDPQAALFGGEVIRAYRSPGDRDPRSLNPDLPAANRSTMRA